MPAAGSTSDLCSTSDLFRIAVCNSHHAIHQIIGDASGHQVLEGVLLLSGAAVRNSLTFARLRALTATRVPWHASRHAMTKTQTTC